ncbi:MAG TPA: protein-disulfide reductase DsbD family protein [Bdellovibrionales bacterium]|nr:protein-disulfide reductase DsbD family protein [Bdellovibrionales bacterium]
MLLCLTFLSAGAAHAAKDFSSWRKFSQGQLIAETTALAPGSSGTIGLSIALADKWHTYWVNAGDSGAAPTFTFKNTPGLKVKQVHLPAPTRFETGPLISFGYAQEVLFLIEVEVSPSMTVGKDAEMTLDAEWLVCAEVCIPAIDTLKLAIPIRDLAEVKPAAHFARFQKTRSEVPEDKVPHPKWRRDGDSVKLEIPEWREREFMDFFPFKGSGVTNAKPEAAVFGETLTLKFAAGAVAPDSADRVGALMSRNLKTGQIETWSFGDSGWSFSEPASAPAQNIWWMLLSAFLGGLILNLMPCVFPILSMKLLSLLKISGAHPGEVRRQNLAYVAGVLVSFLIIAFVLFGLRSAGQLVGWGFQLQSPVFLTLLSWLFFALSLNLLGVFEVGFLNAGVGHKLTKSEGLWGAFFTGVLAVVVASPCTAPFMGAALGFGLTQSSFVLIAIFLCLGLGLSAPYLVFAVFPRAIRVLPKPGKWMNTVKQVMAFPMLLTTLWLLWVLSQVRGSDALMVVLAGGLIMAFSFWLAPRRAKTATALTAVALTLGIVYVYRAEQQVNAQIGSEVWQAYSEAGLEKLKGRRVFINMTADWCLTCKVNERLVFNDPEVMALLEAKQVVLVKGDWTKRNAEITRFLNRFERVGVPFYVLYSPQHPQGQILPEVLTKSTFMDLIQREFP